MSHEERQQRIESGNIAGQWFGGSSNPTIYDNGGLPTPIDRIPAKATQRAAPGSNYAGNGATDPDTNARNLSAPSRINASPDASRMYAGALDKYDPLGTKPMRDASEAGRQQVQSLYPRGTYPDAPFRNMANTLADESAKRMNGPTASWSGAANPNSVYGQGSVRTSSGLSSFAEDGQTYNVGATSQDNIRRVTGGKLNSPLYTNIDPSQAVAGLRNQSIGQPADQEAQGLARMQRANDIRGEMIANRDARDARDGLPPGGYGPGILQDPNEALNAERTQRWGQEDLMRYAKNNPEMRGIVQELFRNDALRDTNANNVAGRMNELGLQGRNQLAAYGMQGRNQLENTMLGEGLRGRNQQAAEDSRFSREAGMLDKRIAAEAPYREAQMQSATNQGRYYDSLQQKTQDEIASGKNPANAFKQAAEALAPLRDMDENAYKAAMKPLYDDYLKSLQLRSKAEKKANGGVVGYADGGAIDPKVAASQKLLLEMQQKYGGAAPSAPQQAAPMQQPTPQQPQQETWMEKARRIGTGGLDRRMEGYAYGGEVDDPQAHAAGLARIDAGKARDSQAASRYADMSQIFNFAEGGPIAVGGRQVFGQSDGSGRDDALPAVIDGERPAALTSGEFVWPVKAVQFYGLDRLNKMLAAAEKGMAANPEDA